MHDFIIICEFKLELQSGNSLVGLWPLWPWPLDLWPWPLAWTSLLSLVIIPENFVMIRWWEHNQKGVKDRQTDRRKENTIHRAAWSQLKIDTLETFLAFHMTLKSTMTGVSMAGQFRIYAQRNINHVGGTALFLYLNIRTQSAAS